MNKFFKITTYKKKNMWQLAPIKMLEHRSGKTPVHKSLTNLVNQQKLSENHAGQPASPAQHYPGPPARPAPI